MCNNCQLLKDHLLISQGFLRQFVWNHIKLGMEPNRDLLKLIDANSRLLQGHTDMQNTIPATPLAKRLKTSVFA